MQPSGVPPATPPAKPNFDFESQESSQTSPDSPIQGMDMGTRDMTFELQQMMSHHLYIHHTSPEAEASIRALGLIPGGMDSLSSPSDSDSRGISIKSGQRDAHGFGSPGGTRFDSKGVFVYPARAKMRDVGKCQLFVASSKAPDKDANIKDACVFYRYGGDDGAAGKGNGRLEGGIKPIPHIKEANKAGETGHGTWFFYKKDLDEPQVAAGSAKFLNAVKSSRLPAFSSSDAADAFKKGIAFNWPEYGGGGLAQSPSVKSSTSAISSEGKPQSVGSNEDPFDWSE